MTAAATSASRRDPFPSPWARRVGIALLAVYTIYAASTLEITWARFKIGLEQGGKFLARMWPPNTQASKLSLIQDGLIESLQIAVLATAVGVILSIPLGLLAARNLMPNVVSWAARGMIALCRSFHPLIVSILFVKAVGFGALAGILALIVSSMGFVSKLFAEAIEEINLKQVEAVRATGAGFFSTLFFAVVPQVMARFVGFAAYQLDSNLRNSTMVGIVGGGGIGATLFTAYQRFDYDVVLTILIAIIAIIMVSELASNRLRKIFQ